jgi:hypothetical protein
MARFLTIFVGLNHGIKNGTPFPISHNEETSNLLEINVLSISSQQNGYSIKSKQWHKKNQYLNRTTTGLFFFQYSTMTSGRFIKRQKQVSGQQKKLIYPQT